MHMSQYIHDNTEAEFTLFNFINQRMSEVQSCQARNLDRFRPLIAARATRTTSG